MDNFFRSWGRSSRREALTATSEVQQPNTGGSYQEKVVSINSMRAALNVPAFARAIQVIADTISQCQMQYQRFDRNGGNFIQDMTTKGAAMGKHINYLCQVRPNPRMSWVVLSRQAMHNMYLKGNAYIYIERDIYGDVQAFWLCNSGTYSKLDDTYNIQYDNDNRVLTAVPATDVIHLKSEFSNDNGSTGMPVLNYAYTALCIAATNDAQTLDNAAKGGKMKLLVQEEKSGTFGLGKAAKKELEKITNQLNEDIYSKDVMLLSNVAGVTPISTNAQQMEMAQTRAFSVREVARIMGVPPILLMDDSNSSYKSPEAATQEFLMRTIAPIVRQWEDEFNAKLIGAEGFGVLRYHMCTDPLMRLDPTGKANIGKTLLESGVMNVDELRGWWDLPTIKGGDRHFISTNLQPVDAPKVTTEPTEPQPTEEGGNA